MVPSSCLRLFYFSLRMLCYNSIGSFLVQDFFKDRFSFVIFWRRYVNISYLQFHYVVIVLKKKWIVFTALYSLCKSIFYLKSANMRVNEELQNSFIVTTAMLLSVLPWNFCCAFLRNLKQSFLKFCSKHHIKMLYCEVSFHIYRSTF